MTQGSIDDLSAREREILERVATGATNQQIAVDLAISINTVKAHLRKIFVKLGVESRTEATLLGIQQGLVDVGLGSPDAEQDQASRKDASDAPESTLLLKLLPHRLHWTQYVALAACLAIVGLGAIWPRRPLVSSSGHDRLIDLPMAVEPNAPSADLPSRWYVCSMMPAARGRFAQVQLDGSIYVIGGLSSEGWSDQVDVYDVDADRWERVGSMPVALANIAGAAVDGLIYVPGGLNEHNQVVDGLMIYDPADDAWTAGAAMPAPLCAYAIAAVPGGFYTLGGWDGERYSDAIYAYDIAADAWKRVGSLTSARGFATAATVEGRIYVVGGHDGASEYASCESYDLALAVAGEAPWQTHASMASGRAGHSMAVADGNLYVVGGGWDSYFSYNERFDVANGAWSTFDSPLVGEWRALGLSAAPTNKGTFIYAVGGWNGRYLGIVQAYQASYRIYIP